MEALSMSINQSLGLDFISSWIKLFKALRKFANISSVKEQEYLNAYTDSVDAIEVIKDQEFE